MAYTGFIVEIKNMRKHTNADRLMIAEIFGNNVIVDLNTHVGDVGVFFPTDGQLSEEFCEYNNLVRKKDAEGNNIGGYLDPSKRNIKAIKLRGEKSEGLFLPLKCFDYLNNPQLEIGDTITVLDGHEICKKYIPRGKRHRDNAGGNRTRKKRAPISPLFSEHADTEQLAYNLNAFKDGDLIEITLKMHGTSQRTGYLPVLKKFKRSLLDIILRREGTPVYDWGYVSGTRRTVLEDYEGGFYGSNTFREQHSKVFEGKLLKGETAYYEVVGYTNTDTPIMGVASNKKTNDKEFIKKYGETTTFSYGCEVGESKTYVYRMTMTNEDGDVIEYTPDFMRYRCEQMGVDYVPVFWSGFLDVDDDAVAGEMVRNVAEEFYDGTDPIGKTHIREGVVVRIVNKPKFTAYKHKNFNFKVLEGIIKDAAEAPDIEEAEELIKENENE